MSQFHLAYTAPINPPSSSPTLSRDQVWAALQRKIHFAQEFVPVIQSCKVLSGENGVVKRIVKFVPGKGPKEQVEETVRGFEPCWVDFEQGDGTVVRNIVAEGAGGPEDLYMTYVFQYHYADIQPGSNEYNEKLKGLNAMAKTAVESSINTIREMVKDGRVSV